MKLKQLPKELKEETKRVAKTLKYAGRPFAPMSKKQNNISEKIWSYDPEHDEFMLVPRLPALRNRAMELRDRQLGRNL